MAISFAQQRAIDEALLAAAKPGASQSTFDQLSKLISSPEANAYANQGIATRITQGVSFPGPTAPPAVASSSTSAGPAAPTTNSVSTGSMAARAGITPQGTPTDVAFGMELQQQMFSNLLLANADRRASVDQTVSIINLLSELERVSPTRAASFAAAMGMGDGPDLGFVNDIGKGAMARVSGRAGNQDISLPLSLSGKDLSFLSNNPNLANIVQDVGQAIGLPDIFRTSAANAIPTSRSLLSMAG